jgi:hypothetical protein
MIKDVAYNTGGAISGTTQVSNVAIATDNNPDYTEGSWVGGVDNSDGYVIVSDTTSTGLVGRTTGGGTGIAPADTPTFWKSAALTDQALLNLINKLPGSAGNYPNVTAARAALAVLPFAIVNDYTGGGGGGAGWLFYAAEGPLVDGPPTTDGQSIFTDNLPDGSTNVTFNPNKANGVNFLNFKLKDSDGVDYTTQFTNLQTSGGTISVTQNGDTATYVLVPGMAFIQNPPGFAAINAAFATQTVSSSAPFVYGDPITITIS